MGAGDQFIGGALKGLWATEWDCLETRLDVTKADSITSQSPPIAQPYNH